MKEEKIDWEEYGMLSGIENEDVKRKLISVYNQLIDDKIRMSFTKEPYGEPLLYPAAYRVITKLNNLDDFIYNDFIVYIKEYLSEDHINNYLKGFEGVLGLDFEIMYLHKITEDYVKKINQ